MLRRFDPTFLKSGRGDATYQSNGFDFFNKWVQTSQHVTMNAVKQNVSAKQHINFYHVSDTLAIYQIDVIPQWISPNEAKTIGKAIAKPECIHAFIELFQTIVCPNVQEAMEAILDYAINEIHKYSDCVSCELNVLGQICMLAINLKNLEYHALLHSHDFDKELNICGNEYTYWSLVACKHPTQNWCFHKRLTERLPRHFIDSCFEMPAMYTYKVLQIHKGEHFVGCLMGFDDDAAHMPQDSPKSQHSQNSHNSQDYKFLIIIDACTYHEGVTRFEDLLTNYMINKCAGLACHYTLESLETINPDLEGVVQEMQVFHGLNPRNSCVLYNP